MKPKNISETINTISSDRLNSYRNYFNLTSDEECLGLYLWNDALSASFFKLISIFEVALRNTIHRELSHQFNAHRQQGHAFDNDWYEYLITQNQLKPKTVNLIRNVTHLPSRGRRRSQPVPKNPVPTPGKVIAAQSFGFWDFLINDTSLNGSIDWQSALFNGLKGHFALHSTYWSQNALDDFLMRLSQVNELRNRIAHHEPIWKFTQIRHHRTNQEIYPAASTPEESIQRMKTLNDRLCRILGWVSEDRKNDYLDSHYKAHFDWLTSLEALSVYKSLTYSNILTPSQAKRRFNGIVKSSKVHEIVGKRGIVTILPGIV
ncbi:CAAX protease [Vibrio cincinnatiensis]|uniref:Abi family protein n=1 Tax=Vibrio cincinnatiensis TaxID=675 RepID=UPI001EDCD4D6|nr:Abi family protein [Vibrio cincinnatiensis]MCG3760325.1 CAAX protease [Vibrio cincinnatiensis]MCG3763649.1 CAAX protease [Vibrio cincinnatiensis]